MRGHRGQARAGDRDPGADFYPPGIRRRQRHRRVTVRPDHLRIADPGAVKAELLDIANHVPVSDMGAYADSKFHRDLRFMRPACAVSRTNTRLTKEDSLVEH